MTIVIGQVCFAAEDETVISWKGDNFYKACGEEVFRGKDFISHCVKRVGHKSTLHEDYDGRFGVSDGSVPPSGEGRPKTA